MAKCFPVSSAHEIVHLHIYSAVQNNAGKFSSAVSISGTSARFCRARCDPREKGMSSIDPNTSHKKEAAKQTGFATLGLNGKQYELPVFSGTVGPDVIDISKLYGQSGAFTYDPGFTSTAACKSMPLANSLIQVAITCTGVASVPSRRTRYRFCHSWPKP